MKNKKIYLIIVGVILLVIIAAMLFGEEPSLVGRWAIYDHNSRIVGKYEFTSEGQVHANVYGQKFDGEYIIEEDQLVIKEDTGTESRLEYKFPDKKTLLLNMDGKYVELLKIK